MPTTLNSTGRPEGVWAAAVAIAMGIGLSLLSCVPALAWSPPATDSTNLVGSLQADFSGVSASSEARQIADWIVQTRDNRDAPFIIVDKKATQVFVFDGQAKLRGASTALLGLARGDDSAEGVGQRPLSKIPPGQRTTPAGRFVASLGLNLANQDILWVDYDAALALHRVLDAKSPQRRLERLAAASPLDRRITFGCINVPVSFYEDVVRPQFVDRTGVVYILPETKSLRDVFLLPPA